MDDKFFGSCDSCIHQYICRYRALKEKVEHDVDKFYEDTFSRASGSAYLTPFIHCRYRIYEEKTT